MPGDECLRTDKEGSTTSGQDKCRITDEVGWIHFSLDTDALSSIGDANISPGNAKEVDLEDGMELETRLGYLELPRHLAK